MSIKDKHPTIIKAMEVLAPHPENVRSGKGCTQCNSERVKPWHFNSKLSLKEFSISGMCQVCQDNFFGVD